MFQSTDEFLFPAPGSRRMRSRTMSTKSAIRWMNGYTAVIGALRTRQFYDLLDVYEMSWEGDGDLPNTELILLQIEINRGSGGILPTTPIFISWNNTTPANFLPAREEWQKWKDRTIQSLWKGIYIPPFLFFGDNGEE